MKRLLSASMLLVGILAFADELPEGVVLPNEVKIEGNPLKDLKLNDSASLWELLQEGAKAAGIDPGLVDGFVNGEGQAPRRHHHREGLFEKEEKVGAAGPLFPPAEVVKEELEIDYCYKVAPFNAKYILRINKGPGHFDTVVYPVVYNRVTKTEVIYIHSVKGVILDKVIERSEPKIKWLTVSERWGNEWEIARAAKAYIAWLNTKACQ